MGGVNESALHLLTTLLAIAVVVEGLTLVAVLRHLGAVLLRMGPDTYGDVEEGPPIGTPVVPEAHLFERLPGIVVFVSPTCSLCKPLVPRLPSLGRELQGIPIVAAVIGDPGPAKDEYADRLRPIARSDLDTLYADWKVPGTPYAVGVSEDGLIAARGVVNSVAQIESLAEAITTARVDQHGDGEGQQEDKLTRPADLLAGAGTADGEVKVNDRTKQNLPTH